MSESMVPAKDPTPPEMQAKKPAEEQNKDFVAEIKGYFDKWRNDRRPYEQQWFINAAFLRGNQRVVWNEATSQLEKKPIPPHRIALTVNRILPKIRARVAKFTKNRWMPVVVPASQDREDWLNARATQKILEYEARKQNLETKYKEALLWSQTTGKGFWWFYWDATVIGRVQQDNPILGPQVIEAPMGDIGIEVGSPFEVFVEDPGKMHIGDQPRIIRAKIRNVEDLKARYPKFKNILKADTGRHEAFQYERQIANLTPGRGQGGTSASDKTEIKDQIMVLEYFEKPSAKFPKGRYAVVAGEILLKAVEELPYGFSTFANPYPVAEFNDTETAGQFWPTTHVEQMIGLQQEYNALRSGLQEHIRLMKHPKVFVPEQFRISKDSWTTEPGELIRYVAMPGIPPPMPWVPPQISGDVWRLLDTMKQEFDDVTNIYPQMQGSVGGASSGFQTNLLQEASDSVHAPDIRQHELSLEDAHFKMRRMIAAGWDVPRLIAVTGRNYQPEVMEFSSDQIDENADIMIQSGSGLSSSPAVRSQQVFELYNSGLLGDPADPETRRKGLGMLNLNTQSDVEEINNRDESLARLENLEFMRGVEVEFPKPWENHDIHWLYHTDQLKSPEIRQWPQERVLALVAHVVMHAKFVNPQNAISIANEFGLTDLIPLIQPPAPPPGQVPPPQGAPPPPQDGVVAPGEGPTQMMPPEQAPPMPPEPPPAPIDSAPQL